MKSRVVIVSMFAVLSFAAHAQNPGDTCNQGQCSTGAFCDFSVLPTPMCRATPSAPVAAPLPAPVPAAVVMPGPAPVLPPSLPPMTYVPPATTMGAAQEGGLFRFGFAEGASDQRSMQRRIGVGFTGRRQVAVERLGDTGDTIQLGVFNLRYWAGESWGVDLGLGGSWVTSAQQTNDGDRVIDSPGPRDFGGLLHVGVPFVVNTYKDFSILFAPEVELGLTNVLSENVDDADQSIAGGGLSIGLGARVGGELHFGMIGLPQLAVESSLGLGGRFGFASAKQGKVTTSSFTGDISLPAFETPLDLVLGNLAIRYYL
jgi:hypothetical protein